jgi:hypothetical protein
MRALLACAAALMVAMPASAQVMGAPTPDMVKQFEKATGKVKGQSLGIMMVVGTLVGCTQKQVGPEKTKAFYTDIEKIGKEAEALCKQAKPAEARQLILNAFAEKKNDPTLRSLLNCYDINAVAISQMAGTQLSMDTAHYVRWVRDPKAATREMKESDICRHMVQGPEK